MKPSATPIHSVRIRCCPYSQENTPACRDGGDDDGRDGRSHGLFSDADKSVAEPEEEGADYRTVAPLDGRRHRGAAQPEPAEEQHAREREAGSRHQQRGDSPPRPAG